MNYIFGADVGFYAMKLATERGVIIFPSVVGPWLKAKYRSEDSVNPQKHMAFEYDGNKFYVGQAAIDYSTPRSTLDSRERFVSGDEGLIILLAAMAQATGPGSHTVDIAVTLPVNEWARLKDEYKARVQGHHYLDRLDDDGNCKHTYHWEIKTVMVLPQGLCANVSHRFDPVNQSESLQRFGQGQQGIIDIGENTVDVVWVDGWTFRDKLSDSWPRMGLQNARILLADAIRNQYGVDLGVHELEQVMQTRQLEFKGEIHSMAEVVQYAAKEAAAEIKSKVLTKWPDHWKLKTVTVTGGGASLLGPLVAEPFANKQVSNSVFQHSGIEDNAVGAYHLIVAKVTRK